MRATLLGLTTGLLLAGSSLVFAQTSPAPAPTPEGPPAAKTTGTQQLWYSRQADEMRASKLIGTTVVNAANETVGDVNEVVLTKDGKVAAVILGVGGFLGMGEREVAVNFNSIRMNRDQSNNLVLTVNARRKTLRTLRHGAGTRARRSSQSNLGAGPVPGGADRLLWTVSSSLEW